MSDELFFDGARYIPAADAAGISNFTRDYIARLAREGKVVGRQVGRQWYVSQESLRAFLLAQEYSNSQRRGALTRERQQEYGRTQGIYAPQKKMATLGASQKASAQTFPPKFNEDLHRKLTEAAMRGSAHVVSKATAIVGNATAQMPLYAVTPGVELLHKIAAAVLALVLVVGLYSAEGSLIATSPQFVPGTTISPEVELTAATGFLGGTFGNIASALQTGVDAFFAPLFGVHLAQGNATTGVVSVNITQRPATGATLALTRTSNQTIIQNPVIERVVQSEQVISSGGISESELTQKLQELNNELSEEIYTATAANSTVIAQNYNVTAQTNAIDQLTDTAIYSPTITGGSITGTSVNASALSVSGTATSTFAAGIDIAGGCFAVAGTCITGGGGGGSTNPGGSDTQVQFNDNGVFQGSSSFTFASSTATLSVLNFSATNATTTTFAVSGLASTSNLVVSNGFTLGSVSGILKSIGGVVSAKFVDLASDVTGILPIGNGGTGTTSAPALGQVLVGNSSGGYSLVSTSSLGIVAGGGSSNVSTSSQNTWSALQIFAGNASSSNFSNFGVAYFGGTATSSFNSAGQLTLAGISNALLSPDANGQVVATTTIGSNLLSVPANSLLAGNAAGQLVATTSIGANLLSGTLGVGNGGTGSTTLSGFLIGNGTLPVQTAVISAPLTLTGNTLSISQANGSSNGFLAAADWTTFNNKVSSTSLSGGTGISYVPSTGVISNTGVTSNIAGTGISVSGSTGAVTISNTGVTSFAQTYGTAQTGAITIGTSTLSFNGLTAGNTISNSAGTFTVTPTLSGTLDNSGLTHSSITVNGTTISLGSSGTITTASSTLFSDNNTWTGSVSYTHLR